MRFLLTCLCVICLTSTAFAQDELVLTGPDTFYLGLPANFTVTGADPGETVKLYFSWTPDEETCPGFLFGACLSFGMPIPNVGNGVADDLGSASISARVTAGVGLGETLLFQAVVTRGDGTVVSNLVTGSPVYAVCDEGELWDFATASCVSGGSDSDYDDGYADGYSTYNFSWFDLSDCDPVDNWVFYSFEGANMSHTNMAGHDLSWVNMSYADISLGNFEFASLFGANLEAANLFAVSLFNTDLTGANLKGADLSDSIIIDSTLDGANLTDANLDGAWVIGGSWDDVTYSNTTCPDGTNSDSNGGTCLGHL